MRGYWGNWDWFGRGFGCFGEIWRGGGLGMVFDGDFRGVLGGEDGGLGLVFGWLWGY